MTQPPISTDLPEILLPPAAGDGAQGGGQGGALGGANGASVFGPFDFLASLTFAFEHGGYTGTEISAHLHNKIAFSRRARARAGSAWGRLQNRVSGDDPDYVPLPGSLLSALFRALGTDNPVEIAPDAVAMLRLDIAEALLEAVDEVLARAPAARTRDERGRDG